MNVVPMPVNDLWNASRNAATSLDFPLIPILGVIPNTSLIEVLTNLYQLESSTLSTRLYRRYLRELLGEVVDL